MSSKSTFSRRDLLTAGAALMAGPFLLSLPGCAGTASLLDPTVDAYDLFIKYQEQTISGFRMRTRTYNGTIPGPIIETRAGHRLRVTMHNQLPPNPHADMPEPHNPNNPHDFNTTNLHVHGLHVIPHLFEPLGTSNPDAKMIAIEPGETYEYNFDIPEDQPSGLFWYHAHHHGSTATQTFGGMAGVILVRGSIDEVPQIKAAKEYIVAVQSLRLEQDVDDPTLLVMDPIAGKPADQGGFKTNDFYRTLYTVNGEVVAWKAGAHNAPNTQLAVNTINARPGEVIRIRFLNGTDEQFMPLEVEGHTCQVIGYDGIPLAALLPETVVETAPGNRVEFLLKMGAAGSYMFKMRPAIGEQFEDNTGFNMLNIMVSGDPVDMALPTSLPAGMSPLPDPGSVSNHIEFATVFPYPELITGVGFTINGLLYKEDRIDHKAMLGTVEDWEVMAHNDEGHPLHVHVNAFQVVEINGNPVDPPVYKDTVWVKKGDTVKIRIRFEKFKGKSVYHCHILIHEDTGMMQNFIIS